MKVRTSMRTVALVAALAGACGDERKSAEVAVPGVGDVTPDVGDVAPDVLGDSTPEADTALPGDAPPIVLFHDPARGAGWDPAALQAYDPYDYESEGGKLRDAVERFLQEGIWRMTGKTPELRTSAEPEASPPGSIVLVLYPDAPARIRELPALRTMLGREGDAEPDYIADREAFYLEYDGTHTWVVANRSDGLVAAMPALLASKGYEVLGLGPNWVWAPDLRGQNLVFDVHEGDRDPGFYFRRIGGFGAGGDGSLTVGFPLTSPDEDVTRSYARWRIGMRMNAGASVPFFTGDSLDSYVDMVIAIMREEGREDGMLTAKTVLAPLGERPPASAETKDWLWIDSDDADTWWCDGESWNVGLPQAVGFSIDLSVAWVRELLLDALIRQANDDMWARPDDWSVFGTQPADGPGLAHLGSWADAPDWYERYREAEGQGWQDYVLHGFRGYDQPRERFDTESATDTAFGFGNWLLREYDKWVDTLPEGAQADPETPTRLTRSGRDRKQLIRSGLSSYNENDVMPHFNLDPRIRLIIGGFPKHRGLGEWERFRSREVIAEAFAKMLPDEPIANYASADDWGWDPEHMSYVLPHRWGNTVASIRSMFESFRAVGVRSWAAEMEMGYTQHTLGLYLMGQYLWRPTLDPEALEALRQRWLVRAFGEAGAPAMQAYFDATEPGTAADVPNFWARAVALLSEADRVIPDGTDYQRRLDDVRVFWYFYYLMDTGQLVRDEPRAQEMMWKGQSSYTVCMYEMSYWVFFTPWLTDMPELKQPVDWTAGPAHYTPEDIAGWWPLVEDHWQYQPVANFAEMQLADGTLARAIDLNDLVSVSEFQGLESALSDALTMSAYDTPGVQGHVAAEAGSEVGFALAWPAYDPPNSQGYWGPHETEWTLARWDTDARVWSLVDTGFEASRRVAADANYSGQDLWAVTLHYPAPSAGTYRVTIGYGGVGQLANAVWDVRDPPVALGDDRGFTFTQGLLVDPQPQGDGIWMYLPKGLTSLDFEMLDPDRVYPKTLTLYRGLPLAESTPSRTVDIGGRGTHRVALAPGEDGGLVKLELGSVSLTVPHFYSVPRIWARSPSALLVPRAVARADGLGIR